MEHDHAAAPGWLQWVEQGVVAQTMRQSAFLYPAVETLHILGFVLLVGGIIGLDLRLLGVARFLPATALARHLLPISITGFLLAAPTGAMLFATEAGAIARNPVFQIKLALISLALLNAAAFHLGPWGTVASWRSDRPPFRAQLGAGLSVALWVAALSSGRLIAYF